MIIILENIIAPSYFLSPNQCVILEWPQISTTAFKSEALTQHLWMIILFTLPSLPPHFPFVCLIDFHCKHLGKRACFFSVFLQFLVPKGPWSLLWASGGIIIQIIIWFYLYDILLFEMMKMCILSNSGFASIISRVRTCFTFLKSQVLFSTIHNYNLCHKLLFICSLLTFMGRIQGWLRHFLKSSAFSSMNFMGEVFKQYCPFGISELLQWISWQSAYLSVFL